MKLIPNPDCGRGWKESFDSYRNMRQKPIPLRLSLRTPTVPLSFLTRHASNRWALYILPSPSVVLGFLRP